MAIPAMRKVAIPEMMSYFAEPMHPNDDVCKKKYDCRRYRGNYWQMEMHHERTENVHFADGPGEHTTNMYAMEETRSANDTSVELGNFLSRPVQIDTFLWAAGGGFNFTIDPWNLFLSNPRVSNRICNYKMLRGKLCVKVVVNGNGFYYGRGMVSYNPAYARDEWASSSFYKLLAESQRQKIFIDPTLSEGGTLHLPFFNPYNAIDLNDIGATTFGQLDYSSLNTLRHVNGGTVPLTITTYAWMEDVSLDGLTTVNISTLTPQMAMSEEDENKTANDKGVISGALTAAANVAGTLTQVPAMADVALPAQAALKIGANVAKMFGYSRPNISKTPDLYNPRPFSSLSTTTNPDTSAKLTGDAEQSMALGSDIAGIKQQGDPMGFANIASIESYLTTFDWNEGLGNGTFLWNMRVHPLMFRKDGAGNFWFTPSAVASLPFETWTGSMKIRFQIVCSSMHKGRLRITYDPNYTDNVSEYNTVFTRVVDISDETDFTICVKPTQIKKYMTKPPMTAVLAEGDCFSTTRYTVPASYGNGVVSVSIVNALTSVAATANDVQVNVYTSFCDDFHVNEPGWALSGMSYFAPPSFQMDMGAEAVANPASNLETTPNEASLAEENKGTDHQAMVYYGEDLRSFRNYIKRYILHVTLQSTGVGDTTVLDMYTDPWLRGNSPAGNISVGFPMVTFVKNCFAGWRGSFRWKMVRDVPANKIYLYRAPIGVNNITQVTWGFPMVSDRNNNSSHGGAILNTSVVNDVVEFETPFYSEQRFAIGRQQDLVTPTYNYAQWIKVVMKGTTVTDWNDFFVAAGEDFEVYGWIGCPPMQYVPNI